MSVQLAPSEDLGLQHVLENGLAVIEKKPIEGEASRRTQILDSLIEIFSEADLGSQALDAKNLMFAVEQGPAFDRFSLFFHYLQDVFGDELCARLKEATAALTEIRNAMLHDEDRRRRTADFIQSLLAALHRESARLPLVSPNTFQYE
jgi:hypothetical protein